MFVTPALARRSVRWSIVSAAVLMLASCATFEESGLPGSASSMARNQMMYVRKEPVTFGYYRLTSLAKLNPDLDLFIRKRGTPDFLAETTNRGQSYYILYYLRDRQAFASRTRRGRNRSLEFAGPYPVTDSEFKTLDGIRKGETP